MTMGLQPLTVSKKAFFPAQELVITVTFVDS
jgi:hypothetical protein